VTRITPSAVVAIGADLLFCPFFLTFFYDPRVPMVCNIRDLNHLYNPQFFTPSDRAWRDRAFRESCRLADRLICISEFTRQTVLANSDLAPNRVITVHHRLSNRLRRQDRLKMANVLDRLGLFGNDFLLYPTVTFWPHKNHRVLFTAFEIFHARHPELALKLICTGKPDTHMEDLQKEISRLGLEGRIVLPGLLSDDELAALFQSCRAMIFPSLFEGFGMPVLEAMAFGKPVLCSNVTSLPEVAGDAALYFDPREPQEIVNSIERVMSESSVATDLVERGRRHLATLGGPEQMALEYLQVFREAVASSR
jgi:glycosyltransferase involved in cell wall biosynthesis